jgi:Fur family transcriptional regulator, ferric uptake regulator
MPATMQITEAECTEILTQHAVRKTDTRIQVLELLFKYEHAITQNDLEKELGNSFDKVTLHRTLHTFEQAGIVHEIPVEGESKFALSKICFKNNPSQSEPIYFTCQTCKHVYYLDGVPTPQLAYKGEFEINSLTIAAKGVCKNCKGLN